MLRVSIGCLALLAGLLPVLAAEPMARGVLIVDGSAGAAAGGPFYAGIVSATRSTVNNGTSEHYSIYVENLDLGRFQSADHEKALDIYFSAKYRDKPVGVIVAVGFDALRYILNSRTQLWPTVPVVFTFVDPSALKTTKLPPDVTGTTLKLKFADMVDAARVVVPGLKGLAVVGDAVPRLLPYSRFQDEIPDAAAAGLQIIDLRGLTMREIRSRVAVLPDQTAIAYTSMNSDGEGTFLAPVEALRRFADAANRPIIVTVETQVGAGGTGGFVASPQALGKSAGDLVLRILRGEDVTAIPVREDNVIKPIFDWRQLQRWNVDESQLPEGSAIYFRNPTVWQEFYWRIVAIAMILLVQSLLIGALIYEGRRRRRAEMRSGTLLDELSQMNRVETAGQLTASIAHEIRQPLGAMVANAGAGLNFLKADMPDLEEVGIALRKVVNDGHRADDLINNIRAMFNRESAPQTKVDVNEIIKQVLTITTRVMESKNIALETSLVDGPRPTVMANQIQLQQVILNLVMNAVEAISSSDHWARILKLKTTTDSTDTVVITVDDSGPGIDSKVADKIFEPFLTTKPGGMGMGLSICKSIVEAHGGELTVSPGKPRGTIFQLVLPLSQE